MTKSKRNEPVKASDVEVTEEAVEQDREELRERVVTRRAAIMDVRRAIAAGKRKSLFPELDHALRSNR